MIRSTVRMVVGVVTVWLIGVATAPTVSGQHGPGMHRSGPGPREPRQSPNLTGEWRLNRELTDDPAKAMQSLDGAEHGGGASGGMGGHGPGRHVGGGHGGVDAAQMEVVRTRVDRAIEAPNRLTITQADSSITFTDGEGRSQTLAINNKREKRTVDGRTVDVRTKWDDARLVKETHLDDGMKLTETYTLADPRQLHVIVKLEGSPLPRAINVRRVYNAGSPR